jgi:hypothetical protein
MLRSVSRPALSPGGASRTAARARRRSRAASPPATLLALVLSALAVIAPVTSAQAAAPSAAVERTEVPVASSSTQTGVAVSLVRLRVPLPASAAAHPEACDWISYLRFRRADAADDRASADAITVLMPGNLEGAAAFDPVARSSVREAARRGRTIEVWATDRRANCLEDSTGLEAMERSGDPQDYLDYYYGGREIEGRRFAGWRDDPRVLADLGVAQTIHDYHAILTRELPDQAWREQHVICGGHSLAGALVELYAAWDFDGDRGTTSDAGYRQCAGFLGLETLLDLGLTSGEPASVRALQPIVPGIRFAFGDPARRALRAGTLLRHEELLGIGPETMAMMEAASIMAAREPQADATPWLRAIPQGASLRAYDALAGSAGLAEYAGRRARLTQLRFTNAGLLGHMFDDNGGVLSVIRASFGAPVGAPLIRNRLPEQLQLPGVDWLFRPGRVMIPRRLSPQPLSGWRDYDELAAAPAGAFTTPASEVTSARDFARILHEGPTNFTESWFPTRIVTDIGAVGAGDRGGGMAGAIHPHPTRRKPRFTILASGGVILPAHIRPLDPYVVLPGYEHLDVLTAAERQNDGRPEGSSTALVDFALRTTG